MYNDNNPLKGHTPEEVTVTAQRRPLITIDALDFIKANPKEKKEIEKRETFAELLQNSIMQFEMEKLLTQMQQQRLQQPSNQVWKDGKPTNPTKSYALGSKVQKFPGGGKVYDEKTNQMLIVDKDNLQIFNIKGEQLDWDDFKDRKWAARGNQKALADKKNQEIENQGITSEYAKRRTSDSEAILNILHNRAGGQYENYLDNVDATTDSIKHLIKEQNETSYAESPLSWQFGVPIEGFVKRANDYKVSEYTPSQPMKMFSYNPDYYFSPLGKGYEGDIINALLYGDKLDSEDYSHLSAPYYDEAKNNFNKQIGSLLQIMNAAYKSKDKKSQQQTTIGHMGGMTAFYNKDENGKPYVSLVDDWNLDPQVTMGSMVKAVPDFILKGKLKEMGVPEDKHDDFIQKYKAGKSISEILGYGHGLPIYDRVYFDESKVKEGTITRESIQHPYVIDNLKKIKTLDSLQSNKIYPFTAPKSYKHGGQVIDEYEVDSITPEQIAKLQAQGYDVEVDGVMHYANTGKVKTKQNGKNKNY